MEEKYELMKAMHTIVQSLNDERAYFDRWILLVPDGATDEDLRDIAEDEELFTESVKCFKEIMGDYLDGGIYVDKNLY